MIARSPTTIALTMFRRPRALTTAVRRLCTESFYDSQSGRTVTVPTTLQLHVGLSTVPSDRVSSALQHLLQPDRKTPVKGIASVLHDDAVSDSDFITISDPSVGVEQVKAASESERRPRVLLPPSLCTDLYDLQLHVANLGDAGADAILLSVDGAALDNEELRELVDMACEVDLLGVPVRSRLGLAIKPSPNALDLASFAYKELGLLHHVGCLAGKAAPKPSDLLTALGVKRPDAAFGKLFLAEHVPDAA